MTRRFSNFTFTVLFLGTSLASSVLAQGMSPWTRTSAMEQIDQVSLKLLAEAEKISFAEGQSLEADGFWWPQGKLYGNAGMGPGYKGAPLNGYSDADDLGPILRGGLETGVLLTGFGQVIALKALARQGIEVSRAEVDVMRHVVRTEIDAALVEAEVAQGRANQLKDDGVWIQKIEDVVEAWRQRTGTSLSGRRRRTASSWTRISFTSSSLATCRPRSRKTRAGRRRGL